LAPSNRKAPYKGKINNRYPSSGWESPVTVIPVLIPGCSAAGNRSLAYRVRSHGLNFRIGGQLLATFRPEYYRGSSQKHVPCFAVWVPTPRLLFLLQLAQPHGRVGIRGHGPSTLLKKSKDWRAGV